MVVTVSGRKAPIGLITNAPDCDVVPSTRVCVAMNVYTLDGPYSRLNDQFRSCPP